MQDIKQPAGERPSGRQRRYDDFIETSLRKHFAIRKLILSTDIRDVEVSGWAERELYVNSQRRKNLG